MKTREIDSVKFKPLKGFESLYVISKCGEIINIETGKTCKHCNTKYPSVSLRSTTRRKTFWVHRLLCETFLPNPKNKPNVNHKDGNKKNFDLSNLEWCTQSENVKHAFDIGLQKPSQKQKLAVKIHNMKYRKLTDEQFLSILRDYSDGGGYGKSNAKILAAKYGIKKDYVYEIGKGKIKRWTIEKEIKQELSRKGISNEA